MVECKYDGCEEEVFENSDYCILHVELPEDEESEEFKRITRLKYKKIQEKISKDDFNFNGINVFRLIFKEKRFNNINMTFLKAKIKDHVEFYKCEVVGSIIFDGAEIGGHAWFFQSKLWNNVSFVGAIVGLVIFFQHSKLYGDVKLDGYSGSIVKKIWFWGIESDCNVSINNNNIKEKIQFDNGQFGGNIEVIGSTIEGNVNFDDIITKGQIKVDNSKIYGNIQLKVKPEGITFESTKFKLPKTQEKACRIAKNYWNGEGDRESADYYFYHEMEAKRKQKKWYFRYPEVIIQYCFGYGVYPGRFIVTWISVILVFTVIYSTQSGVNGNLGFWSYFYSSVVTAITPGFGTYRPDGIYQLVASVEAILGTFMWAAFIATFTRKYMR